MYVKNLAPYELSNHRELSDEELGTITGGMTYLQVAQVQHLMSHTEQAAQQIARNTYEAARIPMAALLVGISRMAQTRAVQGIAAGAAVLLTAN
jgi:hypothetical protein